MFITFEGIDGAGKTTQIERLQQHLAAAGYAVVCTREPGGTKIGDAIRALLLDPSNQNLSPATEALLYAASRAQLLQDVIRPALKRGQVVICDRYVDASVAYQGAGLLIGKARVAEMNLFATDALMPDLTLMFDFPVEDSQARVINSRADSAPDRIERRSREYFTCVRAAFLAIAAADPSRVQVVNATQDRDTVEQEIWQHVSNYIQNRG